jgi:unsaturated chondroitin disaccharide hydrolase
MQTKESITKYNEISVEEAKNALQNCISIVENNLQDFTKYFPNACSENLFYAQTENDDWTDGFWTGEIWLAYEKTKKDCFKIAATEQVDSFLDRIEKRIVVDHHDMGFLYSLSCVSAYKLTKNQTAKKAALMAANNLLSRFQEKGNFIQAWGKLGAEDNYRLIIDSLLNMPLLFWASEVSGDCKYREIATKHIDTVFKYAIKPDFSTYHTYYFDKETGEPLKGVTRQGNRDGSSWARGQAWGIYGIALSYQYLSRCEYLDLFENIVDYFIKHLPDDLIPYWDFDFDTGSDEPRDSSASAIAACGLLTMSKYLNPEKSKYYKGIAKKLIKALNENCAVKDIKLSNGLLLHGTYVRGSNFNNADDYGVNECNLWGDYFYMEALTRLLNDWDSYW